MHRVRRSSILPAFITILIGWLSFFVAIAYASASQGAQESYALVYNGPVSAEDCPEAAGAVAEKAGLSVRFIASLESLPEMLQNAAIFIIGGTQDELRPLLRAFTPRIRTAFQEYLRKGGRYLGICGGGFLVSTGWSEGDEHITALGLIPAASAIFQDDLSARILPIHWRGKIRPMFVKAGPSFQPTAGSTPVQIIATYSDGSVAGLLTTYGAGRIAVVGPHPEARPPWKDEAKNSDAWVSSTDLAVALVRELLDPPGRSSELTLWLRR